jgi:hypothetical protein
MAEIDLVSSHTPWAPLPRLVPWDQVGDGSVFDPQPAEGHSVGQVWTTVGSVQNAYAQSIQYSVQTLVSWVEQVHDPNLVLVMLGDHQPATVVSGTDATHEVPISIVAHDPAVLDRIASWNWTPGLRPAANAPDGAMSGFRNRFLTAFSGG